jgi:hypothetical protein
MPSICSTACARRACLRDSEAYCPGSKTLARNIASPNSYPAWKRSALGHSRRSRSIPWQVWSETRRKINSLGLASACCAVTIPRTAVIGDKGASPIAFERRSASYKRRSAARQEQATAHFRSWLASPWSWHIRFQDRPTLLVRPQWPGTGARKAGVGNLPHPTRLSRSFRLVSAARASRLDRGKGDAAGPRWQGPPVAQQRVGRPGVGSR